MQTFINYHDLQICNLTKHFVIVLYGYIFIKYFLIMAKEVIVLLPFRGQRNTVTKLLKDFNHFWNCDQIYLQLWKNIISCTLFKIYLIQKQNLIPKFANICGIWWLKLNSTNIICITALSNYLNRIRYKNIFKAM